MIDAVKYSCFINPHHSCVISIFDTFEALQILNMARTNQQNYDFIEGSNISFQYLPEHDNLNGNLVFMS